METNNGNENSAVVSKPSKATYSDERVISVIELGPSTSCHVKTYKRNGSQMISVRKYITTEDYTGYTRDGIDFTPQQGTRIYLALNQALNEVGEK